MVRPPPPRQTVTADNDSVARMTYLAQSAVAWREEYLGGSPDREWEQFQRLANEIMQAQLKNRKAAAAGGVPHAIQAGFQAKVTFGALDAELRFADDLPLELRADFAQPGAVYPAMVRFTNAEGRVRSDHEPDLRSVAVRVMVSPGKQHDLLMTNAPVAHARNARQFVKFAHATAGGARARALGLAKLVFVLGPGETVRMVRNVVRGRRQVNSLATESYWSRTPIRWGDTLAVQYLLRPVDGTSPGPEPSPADPDFLTTELGTRLAAGDVRFELCLKRFADPSTTPIEDAAVEWPTPAEPIAVLTIGRRERDPDGLVQPVAMAAVNFNPWNTSEHFRPLGNLNRVRKAAYDASAAHRHEYRWLTPVPVRNQVFGALARGLFHAVNLVVPWYKLGTKLSLLNLEAYRHVLRRDNLIDTEPRDAPPTVRAVPDEPGEEARVWRTFDGSFNDLSAPQMGAVGATFGRNLPADFRPDLYDEPNPVVVSRELLHRETFRPATSLNVLAAAWIQFQVHDWVNHARHPLGVDDVVVPLPPDTPGWHNTPGGPAEPHMRIGGNIGRDGGRLFSNAASHWWDGSQVYGAERAQAQSLRAGAKLRLTLAGYLPDDVEGQAITGFNEAWWLGLAGLHTLFAREHNVICDELRSRYRGWTDDRIYHTARLIVSALIAKIHTVEWTPAILGTTPVEIGLKANWAGPPAHDWLMKLGLWLTDTHARVGIPETMPDHHGAPFSLTEDFVTVYRMHPLIPDEYTFRSRQTGEVLSRMGLLDIQGRKADPALREIGLDDLLYSFGLAHPGAITLHNFPRTLQRLEREGEIIDLSVVDLVRTRRRGVPRYNDFRAGLHKPRITRWEDLTPDPESVRRLKAVYRSIDEVDTMVGLFAETPPPGFGFSDTAFRVFLLMASRRLQSDRFLTVDFRPEVYSPLGMDWIAHNTMKSVILRHCPDLLSTMPRDVSAFAPWRPVARKPQLPRSSRPGEAGVAGF
jgi:hypothetical protein